MQGLVLSAYSRCNLARYLLFRLDDVEMARTWLARVAHNVLTCARRTSHTARLGGDGETTADVNVNVALTATGLALLAGRMSPSKRPSPDDLVEALPGFPYAFVEGMAYGDHRARILGSVGDSAPDRWLWGADTTPRVDVLVCVFVHGTEQDLARAVDDVMPTAGAAEEVGHLPHSASQSIHRDMHEHFGFADGLSQPILAGSIDAERNPNSRHLTAVGEIVCGYPDAFGITTMAPPLGHDPAFGRNGSYLVLAQFHQHVAAFRRAALAAACQDAEVAREIEAKIVGRRHDGTPLVPYVSRDDNEFGFAEDPYGYGCPLGAHVRRANPRDSFVNNNVPDDPPIRRNRHRILRRGRKYGPPLRDESLADDGASRGLFFLCLNADIERQFEFIQQNWIHNPSFVGLGDERDPLIGGVDAETCPFTVPMLPAPIRLTALERFVRLDGGQYFFLPGVSALRRLTGAA